MTVQVYGATTGAARPVPRLRRMRAGKVTFDVIAAAYPGCTVIGSFAPTVRELARGLSLRRLAAESMDALASEAPVPLRPDPERKDQ